MKYKNFLLAAIIVVILDQLLKLFFKRLIESTGEIILIKNFLSITIATNTGAGFSILSGMNLLLIWLAVIVIGGILYFSAKVKKHYLIPLGFIFGGAIGNLIDRLIYGHVIDFIAFSFWPIFNLADSMITIGSIMLIIIIIREK
jgi:signal peptidase II